MGRNTGGSKIVFLVLAVTIIILIIAWFWLQHVIVEFDLDRAIKSSEFIHSGTIDTNLLI